MAEGKDAFMSNSMMQDAVIRNFEIIGEATKRLSETVKQGNTDIPWRQMAGMRDILIHAYNHVDLDEVWRTATIAIPSLIEHIEPLVPPE